MEIAWGRNVAASIDLGPVATDEIQFVEIGRQLRATAREDSASKDI
jgi:hypothetical protein